MLTKETEQKLIRGEIVILEKKVKETTETITLTKKDFIDFIGGQENFAIMDDCVILLGNDQLKYSDEIYRLIHGKRLVVAVFETYAQHFIDGINDNIDMFGLEGE